MPLAEAERGEGLSPVLTAEYQNRFAEVIIDPSPRTFASDHSTGRQGFRHQEIRHKSWRCPGGCVETWYVPFGPDSSAIGGAGGSGVIGGNGGAGQALGLLVDFAAPVALACGTIMGNHAIGGFLGMGTTTDGSDGQGQGGGVFLSDTGSTAKRSAISGNSASTSGDNVHGAFS
jgi:hypothetical protein